VSAVRGVSIQDCLWRAFLAAAMGYAVGFLIFGKLGLSIAREAAAQAPPPRPAAPPAEKPGPPAASGPPAAK
jgi:hypothetical protein